MNPNFCSSSLINKHQILPYLKNTISPIQSTEALKAHLHQVQRIKKRYIVNLLEPHLDTVKVNGACIDGWAEFRRRCISKMFNWIDLNGRRDGCSFPTPLNLPQVRLTFLPWNKVQIILLDVLIGDCIEKEAISVDVYVGEEGTFWIVDFNPVLQVENFFLGEIWTHLCESCGS